MFTTASPCPPLCGPGYDFYWEMLSLLLPLSCVLHIHLLPHRSALQLATAPVTWSGAENGTSTHKRAQVSLSRSSVQRDSAGHPLYAKCGPGYCTHLQPNSQNNHVMYQTGSSECPSQVHRSEKGQNWNSNPTLSYFKASEIPLLLPGFHISGYLLGIR